MFIQAVAQSAIGRTRKLRASWVNRSPESGKNKSGFGALLIVFVVLLVVLLGLK